MAHTYPLLFTLVYNRKYGPTPQENPIWRFLRRGRYCRKNQMEAPRATVPARRVTWKPKHSSEGTAAICGLIRDWKYARMVISLSPPWRRSSHSNQEDVPIALIWFTYCSRSVQTLVPQGQPLIGEAHANLAQWKDESRSSLLWPRDATGCPPSLLCYKVMFGALPRPWLRTRQTWPSQGILF